MVNAYKIDFDNQSDEHNCQFIPDEQTIVGNYLYVLDDYKAYVDQRMEEIFDEEYAQTILEGTMRIRLFSRLEVLFLVSVARRIFFCGEDE
uniref:Uncharacterized protein n=1 Tax=Meloidogyne enterolobii TaxID=390850 RepID=A0A6V7VPL1_MELEN|nr:unnamed protein product [Meloidogyne enterolobii]